jgi:predicted dehydrogenase
VSEFGSVGLRENSVCQGEEGTRMETMRMGIVGCGGMAFQHMLASARAKGVRVSAIAEPRKANRERFIAFTNPGIEHMAARDEAFRKRVEKARGMLTSCIPYTSFDRMIERESLDAIVIVTPHVYHHRQVLDALEAGLHVLVEKPMVCSSREAEDIVKAARNSRKVVGVAYQRHLLPEFVYMRDTVKSGKLGKVEHISYTLYQDWYRFTKGTWRRNPKYAGGGQLMDSGSHIMDVTLWITGLRPRRVYAQMRYFDAKVDVNSALTIEFAGGAVAQIAIVGKTTMGWAEELTITGATGTLRYQQGSMTHYDERATKSVPKVPRGGATTPVANFLDAIRGKAPIAAPPEWGLAVARLTESAFRSAEKNRPVTL